MKVVRTFTLAVVLALLTTTAVFAKGEKPPKPEKPGKPEVSQDGGQTLKPERYEYQGTYCSWDGGCSTESGWYQTHTVLTGGGLLKFQMHSKYESVYIDPWGTVFESNSSSHGSTVTENGYFLDYSSHGWNRYENPYATGVYRYMCTPEGCMIMITENGEKTRINY